MRKTLLLLLGVVVALPALARDFTYTYEGQTLTYTVIDEDAKTCQTKDGILGVGIIGGPQDTPGNDVSGSVIIPAVVNDGKNDYTVTTLGYYAFLCCNELTSVELPSTLKTFPTSSFSRCQNLKSITLNSILPPTLSSYNNSGSEFDYTDIDKVSLIIPDDAISYYLASIWSVFKNIKLKNSGKEVVLKTYSDGILNYRLLPQVIGTDKNLAIVIQDDYKELTEVIIPDRINVEEEGDRTRYYVDAIGYKAFYNANNLKSVTFNSRNTSRIIGDRAFCATEFENITLPASIEIIGVGAFRGCNNLKSIVCNKALKNIEYGAFENSGLENVTFNEALNSIGAYAFSNCNLSSVTFNDALSSIGDQAFSHCKLTSVTLKDATTSLGRGIFAYNKNLTSIHFNKNKVIPIGILYDCTSLTSIDIPEWIEKIEEGAFYECSNLSTVNFSEKLQSIGKSAFHECKKLTNLALPNNLKSIGEDAFLNIEMTGITIPGSVTEIGNHAVNQAKEVIFNYSSNPITIGNNAFVSATNVTCDRELNGFTDSFNNGYLESLTIGNNVKEIPARKFEGFFKLKTIKLGSNVTSIGDNAFSGCPALTEVILPPSVETIGASAFDGATSLSSVIMGSKVNSIGENAFNGCPRN